MKESKACACSKNESNKPKDVKVDNLVKPDDFGKIENSADGKVGKASEEESVVMINPDSESMGSRG